MRIGKYLMAVAAATMTVAPALASPVNAAGSLSVGKSVRTGSNASHKSDLAGGGIFFAIIAAAVVIAGIIVIADNNDNPRSP